MRKVPFPLSLTPAAWISSPQLPKGVRAIIRRKKDVAKGRGASPAAGAEWQERAMKPSDVSSRQGTEEPVPRVQPPGVKVHQTEERAGGKGLWSPIRTHQHTV